MHLAVTVRPFGMEQANIIRSEYQNATSIILSVDGDSLNFLGDGEPARFHSFGCALASGAA